MCSCAAADIISQEDPNQTRYRHRQTRGRCLTAAKFVLRRAQTLNTQQLDSEPSIESLDTTSSTLNVPHVPNMYQKATLDDRAPDTLISQSPAITSPIVAVPVRTVV